MPAQRLFDFIYHQQTHHPLQKSVGYHYEGQWVYFSTDEIIDMARQVSCGLLKLGIQKGDKVALVVYQNRPEWVIMDIGLQQIGAINVPVYPTISANDYEYIFKDSEVKLCFAGKDDLYDRVKKAQANVPSLKEIYTFDKMEGVAYWKDIFTLEGEEQIASCQEAVHPQELATIIYTSGTTGLPKGVMLSHENIVSNVKAVERLMPISSGDSVLSFLPLCHIFERTASYSYINLGASITFTGTDNLGGETGDLQVVKPHFFTTVPRLLEKVYEKIYGKGLALTGLKRKLFFWALQLTEDYEYGKQYSGWQGFQRKLADKLIFSKWRAALGGNIKGILTGAAPCPMSIKRVFSAAGIPIREGYGLTETAPGLAIGRYTPNGAILDAVGPAIHGISLFIDESDGNYRPGEGEILAKGPNIMMGYYNKPEATAEVMKNIDGQDWFCTGDIGRLIDGPNGEKFLQITDRKKELLKTSGGKYVAPAPIESKLKEDFLIEQIMVVGDGQKFTAALIVPAMESLKDWCEQEDIPWTSRAEIIQLDQVVAKYQEIIDKYNPAFSKIEQIKAFRLLDADWEPNKADGSEAELTPTMKLKRRVILSKYAEEIAGIYS